MLWNEHKKVYAKRRFNSKEAALSMGVRWMAYRHEKGVIRGNKIVKVK